MARNKVEGIEILRPGSRSGAGGAAGYGRALASRTTVQSVPAATVATNPLNPTWRVELDGQGFTELQASVAAMGVLQPLIVAPADQWREMHPEARLEGEDSEWVALDGNRRIIAARQADIAEVPIVVRSDLTSDDWTVILHANSGRAELTPIDRAQGFEHALKNGRTQSELAASFGISQPTIAKHLALLRLPEPMQAQVAAGAVSVNAAYAAGANDPEVLELASEWLAAKPVVSTAVFTQTVQQANAEVQRRRSGDVHETESGDMRADAGQSRSDPEQLTDEPMHSMPARHAQESRMQFIPTLVRRQPSSTELRRILVDLWLDDRSMHHEARRMAWRIAQAMGDAPSKADQPGKSSNELLWEWEHASIPTETKPRERAAWLRIVALHERSLRERGNDGRWNLNDAWYLHQLQAVGYRPTAWEQQQLSTLEEGLS